MKKKLLLLSIVALMTPVGALAQNDNQSQIDELLALKEEVDAEAQALYDEFMEGIKPIQDKAMDIQNKLAELGYVSNVSETNNAVYEFLSFTTIDNPMFSGEKILAIEMNFTNKQNQPANPWMTFVVDYAVEQATGQTTTLLTGANGQMTNITDQEAVKMGEANINAGETVKAIIGVRLADESQPVQFILNSTKVSGNPQGFAINP